MIKQPTSLKEARDRTNQVINEKKRKLEEYEALMVVLQVRMAVYQEKNGNASRKREFNKEGTACS